MPYPNLNPVERISTIKLRQLMASPFTYPDARFRAETELLRRRSESDIYGPGKLSSGPGDKDNTQYHPLPGFIP